MKRLCLPCWRKVVHTGIRFEDPYEGWPPLKIYPEGHLDLEFGPFLLADQLVMDEDSFRHLVAVPYPALRRPAASLQRLFDENYLVLVDYDKTVKPHHRQIADLTNDQLKTPLRFRLSVQQASSGWESVSPHYAALIGRINDPIATLPVGFLGALAASGTAITNAEISKIRKVLDKKASRFTSGEVSCIAELTRPYLEHVYSNLALSRELDYALFDWADTGPMYHQVLSFAMDSSSTTLKEIPKVRELFGYLRHFEPSTVDECLHIIRDPRVDEFRRVIAKAAYENSSFDENLANQLLLRASQGRFSSDVMTKISVISTTLGLVASALSATFVPSALLAGSTAAGQEIVGRRLSKIGDKDMRWWLCLADAKSIKKRIK